MGNLIKQLPLTVSTSAYADGDNIGGLLTFTDSRILAPSDKVVHSITLADKSAQNAPMDVVFFRVSPENTTFTDNAALDINDADLFEIVGTVSIIADDYVQYATNSAATVTAIGLPVDSKKTAVYIALVSRGTPTYTSISDLQLTVNYL